MSNPVSPGLIDKLPAMLDEAPGSERNRRFRVRVLKPQAQLVLGQPDDDVGFPGITLQTSGHYLLETEKTASWHVTGSALLQFQERAYLTANELTQNSGTNATIVSSARVLLVAGAGYPDREAPAHTGSEPEGLSYDPHAVGEVIDPVRKASALWAEAAHTSIAGNAVDALGAVRVPPFGSLALHVDRLLPREAAGPLGRALARAARLLGKVERKVARPGQTQGRAETITIELARARAQLEQTQEMYAQLTEGVGDLRDQISATSALAKKGELKSAMKAWGKGDGATPSEAKQPDARGLRAAPRRRWARNPRKLRDGSAAEKLAYERKAVTRVLVSARTLARSVRATVQAVNAVVAQVSGLFGVSDPTRKVLGLAAEDGVTIASGATVVGVAKGGFYFEAPRPPEEPKGLLGKLAGMFKSATKSSAPAATASGDFHVRVAGDFVALAEGEVNLLATSDEGTAFIGASRSGELVGADAAALRATKGTAEVAGKHVVVGYDPQLMRPDRADTVSSMTKHMAALGLREVAVARELAEAIASIATTKTKLNLARIGAAAVLAPSIDPKAIAELRGLTKGGSNSASMAAFWAVRKLEAKLFKLESRRATLEDTAARLKARLDAIDSSKTVVSPLHAAVLGAQKVSSQAPTSSVLVAAKSLIALVSREALELAGKTVSLGRSKLSPGSKPAERIELRGKEIHIEADTEIVLKVKSRTVRLTADEAHVSYGKSKLVVTDGGVKLVSGASSVELTASGVQQKGSKSVIS